MGLFSADLCLTTSSPARVRLLTWAENAATIPACKSWPRNNAHPNRFRTSARNAGRRRSMPRPSTTRRPSNMRGGSPRVSSSPKDYGSTSAALAAASPCPIRPSTRSPRPFRRQADLLTAETFAPNLQRLELSQREFADLLGVAPETVSRWLTNVQFQIRSLDRLMRPFLIAGIAHDRRRWTSRSPRPSRNGAERKEIGPHPLPVFRRARGPSRPHPLPLSRRARGASCPHPLPLSRRARGASCPHPLPLSRRARGASCPLLPPLSRRARGASCPHPLAPLPQGEGSQLPSPPAPLPRPTCRRCPEGSKGWSFGAGSKTVLSCLTRPRSRRAPRSPWSFPLALKGANEPSSGRRAATRLADHGSYRGPARREPGRTFSGADHDKVLYGKP